MPATLAGKAASQGGILESISGRSWENGRKKAVLPAGCVPFGFISTFLHGAGAGAGGGWAWGGGGGSCREKSPSVSKGNPQLVLELGGGWVRWQVRATAWTFGEIVFLWV